MNWLLDIFLVLLFLLIAVVSTRKGFVRSIWSSITIIGSFITSYLFGPVLGERICAKYVLPRVSEFTFDKVERLINNSSGQYDISALFETLPEEFITLASNCGANVEELKLKFISAVTVPKEGLYDLADSIALPISRTLSNAIGIILVFMISVVVLWLVGLVVKVIAKIPIIKTVDSFLGFLLGVVKGLIIVWIVCVAIGFFVEGGFMTPQNNEVLKSVTDQSYILRFFCDLSPVNFINIQ